MRFLTLCLALALGAPAFAQGPVATGAAGRALDARGRIKVDYTEVRAGPGVAYISRGRAYQGDQVEVLRRDASGDWFEVTASGVRGWIRTRAVRLEGRGGRAQGGRDRRQTNYTYDAQGRRQFANGQAMGSGEGTVNAPPPAPRTPPPGPRRLSLYVGFGTTQLSRTFTAAIEADSPLSNLEVSPLAITAELGARYDLSDLLQLRLHFRDARLSEATIGANPAVGFPQAIPIKLNAQTVELDATGRFALGPAWVGAYAGGWLFRQAFQETQPYALLLTNTFVGLHGGAAAGVDLGAVDLQLRGGVVLPLIISQSPADSGDGSALGGSASLEAAWQFHPQWALTAQGHFLALQADYEGGSTHADPYSGDAPRTYLRAREKDSMIGGGLGIRWQP